MTTLRERASQMPVTWDPAPGDVLEGVLTERDSWESKFKDAGNAKLDPVLTILTDDEGEKRFFAHASTAKKQIERHNPIVGDRIAIGYHGKRDPADDQSPHRYRILVEKAGAGRDDDAATQEALERKRDQRDADLSEIPFD